MSVLDDAPWLQAAKQLEMALAELTRTAPVLDEVLGLEALVDAHVPADAELPEPLAPEQAHAMYRDSVEALRQEQTEQALDGFAALVSAHPLDARYLFGFALSLQHLGEVEKAAEYFSVAYGLEPSNGACAFRLGECLWALGHEAEAQDALRAAIELDAVPGADPQIRGLAQHLLDELLATS